MLSVGLIFLGAFLRLIVDIPNFTPVIALALFSGVYVKKNYAIVTPLVLLILTDLIIGLHDTIFFTWGSIVIIALMGMQLRQNRSFKNVAGYALLSAILFFVVTNFGAWLSLYPRTFQGFMNCYIAAIPFFRNTLISTFFYSLILFGSYEMIALRVKHTRFAQILLSS